MDKETLKYLKTVEKIDFAYFALSQIQSELNAIKPKNGLEAMIDKATGYGEEKIKELKDALVIQVKVIINNKQKLGYDISTEERLLQELLTPKTT